jgi:FlaA1/EpsC-like NDP-sugar epimerase
MQDIVDMKAVLITGATGKQGGSLIKSLVTRNAPFEILAVKVIKTKIWGVFSV